MGLCIVDRSAATYIITYFWGGGGTEYKQTWAYQCLSLS